MKYCIVYVDLEDEFGDFDIPNTIVRSKADCPSLEVCDEGSEHLLHTVELYS